MTRSVLRAVLLCMFLLSWACLVRAETTTVFYDAEVGLKDGEQDFTATLRTCHACDLRIMRPEHYTLRGLGTKGAQSLVLGQDSFDDSERIFGPAPIINIGSASNYLRCYTSSRPGDKATVFILPAVGGLGGIMVMPDINRVKEPRLCRPSVLVRAGIATKSGLHLGMSRAEVEALLGPPHGLRKNKLLYAATDEHLTPAERKALGMTDTSGKNMSLLRYITVWLDKEGRVCAFEANAVSTADGW